MQPPRERKHRLPEAAYYGKKCVAFTANEARRKPLLACDEVHDALRAILATAAREHGCTVPVYCLMPDHLHVLLLGTDDASRPKRAMERFKYLSGIWFQQCRPDLDWQKDFYDRIVRRSEGLDAQARYVALNPVRKGLAPDIFAWPYTGSIRYDLREVLLDAWW